MFPQFRRLRSLTPLLVLPLVVACSHEFGDPPAVPGEEEREPGDSNPPRDPGPNPDAGPVDNLPDAGPPNPDCTDQTANLLTNANLDNGPSAEWLENSEFEILVTAPELIHTPQTPTYAAWLGGFDPSVQALAQRLTIPAETKSIEVTGYRLINTNDGSADNDILRFYILDSVGNPLELLADPAVPCANCTYSNTSGVAEAFTAFTLPVTGDYSGQEILFHIQSDLPDDGTNTNFYVDTLAFNVTVCR